MQPRSSSDPKRFLSFSPATFVAVLLGLVVGAGLSTSPAAGQAEPGDRIVIIYGTGYIHYFREQVRGHPQMELVYPRAYP